MKGVLEIVTVARGSHLLSLAGGLIVLVILYLWTMVFTNGSIRFPPHCVGKGEGLPLRTPTCAPAGEVLVDQFLQNRISVE